MLNEMVYGRMTRAAMHAGIKDEWTNLRRKGRKKGETWVDERETTKEESKRSILQVMVHQVKNNGVRTANYTFHDLGTGDEGSKG